MQLYLALLRRNSNYRYLWLGSLVSQLGDWFNLLASAELITSITSSEVAISYLFLARFLPLFFVSPFAGVWADRFDRRRILIASDVLRGVTVLGFLLIRSPNQIWLLYVLTVVQFCLSAFFTPARSAVIANIVSPDDLVTANALDAFTWSTMLAFGALLGGIITAVFGKNTAFIMDAGTFALSAVLISRVRILGHVEEAVVNRGGWFDFIDGFRYLWKQPFILLISLVKGAGSLVWGAINVLEISFANEIFPLENVGWLSGLRIEDGGTATLGIFYVVVGVGTGLGPLLLRRWLGDALHRMILGITIGFVLMGGGILALGFAPTLSTFLVATFVRAVGTGALWVFSAVILQMVVPNRFRGRVFAFEFALLTLTQSISIFTAGFLQDSLGWDVREATQLMGWLGIVVFAVWILVHYRISFLIRGGTLALSEKNGG